MTDHLGQSETSAERTMREVYGYTRRPGQSRDLVTVPFALIQEAEAGCPGGDTKTLLRAILLHEHAHTSEEA